MRSTRTTGGASAAAGGGLLVAFGGWLFGLPGSLWATHRARRRLRAYGPPAVLALRGSSRSVIH